MFSFNPIMVDNYAAFFNCRPAARAPDSMMAPGFNWCFSFAPCFSKLFDALGSPSSGSLLNLLSPRFFIHQCDFHDLFVCP